jgi:short-subunit dehydrogenase
VKPLVKPLDVTDLEQVERVYAELKQTWGRVDIVFYNPAIWAQSTAKAFDTQGALSQIDTMYAGLVRVIGTAMPDMIARRSGDIVGMASLAGYAGMPRSPVYSSAKSAVIALLQSLRIELKDCGVGVVTVNPGFVRTPLTDRNDFPMPFMMEPEVAAELIVKGLLEGKEEIHFPWKLSWPAKVVTALPRSVYEYLARKFIAKL